MAAYFEPFFLAAHVKSALLDFRDRQPLQPMPTLRPNLDFPNKKLCRVEHQACFASPLQFPTLLHHRTTRVPPGMGRPQLPLSASLWVGWRWGGGAAGLEEANHMFLTLFAQDFGNILLNLLIRPLVPHSLTSIYVRCIDGRPACHSLPKLMPGNSGTAGPVPVGCETPVVPTCQVAGSMRLY